jgi:hypothetical protein
LAYFHCLHIDVAVGEMNPSVQLIGLWLWGALVPVGAVCPDMMEMMMLVSLHGAVEDSDETRGKLLNNSQVKFISFRNANILKDF